MQRLLEGRYAWGALEVWSSHYGYTSYCLIVYPPGSTSSDRIRYRLLRGWPSLGLLLGVFAAVLTGRALPLGVSVGIGCATFVASAVVAAIVAGPNRRLIRKLQTWHGDEGTRGPDRGPQHLLDSMLAMLLESEQDLLAGRIDLPGREAVWGRVWEQLGALEARRR